MSTVQEINDIAQLAEHQLEWNALLPQTRDASFFHSFAWLETYWRHFGDNQRLRVLIVYSDDRAIGILPLVVRQERNRLGTLRRLTYPLHGWGAFYGPIGPNPTATLLAALRHIERTPRDWDLLDLPSIARETSDFGRTRQALRQVGLRAKEMPFEVTAQVDCRGGWEEYWGNLKSHWRTNVRRSQKKLASLGEVRYERFRPAGTVAGDDDPRWDLWRSCLALAKSSWQGDSTTGTTLSHPHVRDFLTDMHEVATRQGNVDLNLLYLKERPIAFAYNYHYDGYVYGLRSGFDPELRPEGAGSVLMRHALEESMNRGDTIYDLGPGYLECKRHWWTKLVKSSRCLHYPVAVPKAQIARVHHWLARLRGTAADKYVTSA